MTRTSLTHASKQWPDVITANLWPYAIRIANDSINNTLWFADEQKQTPSQRFKSNNVVENLKHWFHVGCPVYVTNNLVQQGKRPKGGKWSNRAWLGIHLGRSPLHSINVALVLNLKTRQVIPQFHVTMDPMFDTIKNATTQDRISFKWQQATGLLPKGTKSKFAITKPFSQKHPPERGNNCNALKSSNGSNPIIKCHPTPRG